VKPTIAIVAGRPLSSFRAMQYLAVLAALALGAEAMRRAGGDPNAFLLAGFLVFVPAVVGAHAGPALARGRLERRAWLDPQEGSAFFFALPPALVAAPVLVWAYGLSAGQFLDCAAVGVAGGTVFGRVGCLMHGCCGGRPTTGWLGMTLTDVHGVSVRRVPTQLLDAAWAAVLLAGLLLAVGHLPAGVCFFAAAALYGAGRFATDFTRQHRPPSRRLSAAQYGAVALIAVGLGGLLLNVLDSIP